MSDNPIPKSAKARGKIAPAKFAHTVLRTQPERFPAMTSWWKDLLEAKAAFENPLICFMTYDDEHHRLAVVAQPGLAERPLNSIGVDHIAFTYSGLPDLVHTYERLRDQGIEPSTTIHHGPTMSLYYLDPDRNQVELQIDVLVQAEELEAFIQSEHFARNPIGSLFDMEDLCRRFHAGESHQDLTRPFEAPLPGPDAFGAH